MSVGVCVWPGVWGLGPCPPTAATERTRGGQVFGILTSFRSASLQVCFPGATPVEEGRPSGRRRRKGGGGGGG